MILEHTFPELGSVRIPLYKESACIFKALESVPNSGTSHLEKLDHLGELKQVLHCGHHSRYEYLSFQLYLIHFFNEKANAFGLASSIDLPNNTRISSGEELLKSWAIICENGHLYGIYEAERFWLFQFCTNHPVFLFGRMEGEREGSDWISFAGVEDFGISTKIACEGTLIQHVFTSFLVWNFAYPPDSILEA